MRLIDADALKEIIMDMRNHCEPSPCLPHQTFLIPDAVIGRKIDAAPTVDAIPLYFIKDRIEVFKAVPLPACVDTLELLISQWEQVVNADADR